MKRLVHTFICLTVLAGISCSHHSFRSVPSEKDNAGKKRISFAGYTWIVSHSGRLAAPGPNFWNEHNVWVDAAGKLHLKLSKDQNTGLWYCAELYTEENFGPGNCQFFVEGKIDKMDKNVVFGIFNYSGIDKHDEIDIEFSKWGQQTHSNLQYSVWPKAGVEASKWNMATNFDLEGTYTTHRITRSASFVRFQNLHGFRNDDLYPIFEAVCRRKKIISSEPMPLYLNLWLFNGKPPSDGKETEIIIHGFSFSSGK